MISDRLHALPWPLLVCITAAVLAISPLQSDGTVRISQDPDVTFLGAFSQMRQTPEHVYGYRLELWRDATSVVALWSRAEGQPADFPATLTRDVQWNETTGSLQFTATWCDETETLKGILGNRELKGTLTATRKGRNDEPRPVTLIKDLDERRSRPRSEWKALIDRILKARGPKC